MIGHLISEGSLCVSLLAQITGCIAAGLAASYALRRHPARAHQILLTALAASVLTPASYLLVRHFEWGLLPHEPPATLQVAIPAVAPAEEAFVDSFVSDVDVSPVASDALRETPMAVTTVQVDTPRLPWQMLVLACWVACSSVLLVRILVQFVLGLWLLRTREPVDVDSVSAAIDVAKARLGVGPRVTLACHPKVQSPVIWCWSRPPVLLMQKLDQASQDHGAWVGVFCHELAHLKRRDHLSGLFAELVAATIPWHPLAWCARRRLTGLSEQACDDWVLAGGQMPADYAESLLHLLPQRRMAFLPTIVGKETPMKARIYRIMNDRCHDPRIGARWALALVAMVVLTTTTVALAQRQRAPRESLEPASQTDGSVRRVPRQDAALAGRRNVLERMRDQLVAQAERTEAVLRERGDESNERTDILRSELRTLRDQIGVIERQLEALDRRGPRPVPPQPPAVERSIRRGPDDVLDQLRNRQERIQSRLAEIDDPDSEEAQKLREQMQLTQRDIRQAQVRLSTSKDQAPRAQQQRQTGGESAERVRELGSRLREQIAETERALREREEQGQGDSDEANALRRTLRRLRQQAGDMEDRQRQIRQRQATEDRDTRSRRGLDPATPYGQDPYAGGFARGDRAAVQQPARADVQRQVEELRGRIDGLNEQIQQVREMLQQLLERRDQPDPETQPMKPY